LAKVLELSLLSSVGNCFAISSSAALEQPITLSLSAKNKQFYDLSEWNLWQREDQTRHLVSKSTKGNTFTELLSFIKTGSKSHQKSSKNVAKPDLPLREVINIDDDSDVEDVFIEEKNDIIDDFPATQFEFDDDQVMEIEQHYAENVEMENALDDLLQGDPYRKKHNFQAFPPQPPDPIIIQNMIKSIPDELKSSCDLVKIMKTYKKSALFPTISATLPVGQGNIQKGVADPL
jgi:hypothetical protein